MWNTATRPSPSSSSPACTLPFLDPPVASELQSLEHGAPSPARSTERQAHVVSDSLFTLARVIVGVGIVLTVIFGSVNGISQARAIRQNRLTLGLVTVRANQYPDSIVLDLNWAQPAQTVRRWVAIARDDRLSLFATGDAARYLKEKPIPFTLSPLRAVVIIPTMGRRCTANRSST
jgi:hypothetical protein